MEVPSDCVMSGIGFDVVYGNEEERKNIQLTCDEAMVAGAITRIKWNYSSIKSDFSSVNIEYAKIKDEDGKEVNNVEYYPIVMGLSNQTDYYWDIRQLNVQVMKKKVKTSIQE